MKKDEFDAVKWLTNFRRRAQKAVIKDAGLNRLVYYYEVQQRVLGNGHKLVKEQYEVIRKMRDNMENDGPSTEHGALVDQLRELQERGIREITKKMRT